MMLALGIKQLGLYIQTCTGPLLKDAVSWSGRYRFYKKTVEARRRAVVCARKRIFKEYNESRAFQRIRLKRFQGGNEFFPEWLLNLASQVLCKKMHHRIRVFDFLV